MTTLLPTLILFTLMALLTGRIILSSVNTKYFRNLCFYVMSQTNEDHTTVESKLLGSFYVGSFLISMLVASLVFNFNLLPYFTIEMKYLPYIFIGILAELSLSGFLIAIAYFFAPKVQWNAEIGSIPWIDSIKNVADGKGFLIPLIGAFFEETLFRGYIYIILRTRFSELNFIIPMLISAGLFGFQQALNTTSRLQGISLVLGGLAVDSVGCLLIEYTGSFLPALIAHEFFVVFYFSQLNESQIKHTGKSIY